MPEHNRRANLAPFIAIVQTILLLGHALIGETWIYFWGKPHVPWVPWIFLVLSLTFVPASLLSWRSTRAYAWMYYRFAATWLGCVSFLFWASVICWAIYGVSQIIGIQVPHRPLLIILFGAAAASSVAAVLNGSWLRVTRFNVQLPGLPASWKGRTALVAGDLHLGPVKGYRFAQRVVRLARELKPDVVFLTGDFYDGTAVDALKVANTWKDFPSPFGVFYVTGNHEEFTDRKKYLDAIHGAGIRILNNEKVVVGGLQVAGVLYGEASHPETFKVALQNMNLDRNSASVLLSHVPQLLDIPEQAGVSLQLSGHTHRGQVLPWVWLAARVHGKFVYGLHPYKNLQVITTSGAGTWGPPMRFGTRSEVVLVTFT